MKRFTGSPFADSAVVSGYEATYETTSRRADRPEKALVKQMLARFPQAGTLLEVGCRTGHFTRWFGEQGVRAMGLDLSLPMLAEAGRLGSPFCMRGDALARPFSNGVFDLVALITTLEFVLDPDQALAEGLRMAQQGLILGVLNRQSLLGWRLKGQGGPVWEAARLFSPAELSRLVQRAAAGRLVQIVWRTTLWAVCITTTTGTWMRDSHIPELPSGRQYSARTRSGWVLATAPHPFSDPAISPRTKKRPRRI